MNYYSELFSITFEHNFYTDGVCPDLKIEPTQDCEKKLNFCRLSLKQSKPSIKIFAPFEDGMPTLDKDYGKTFSFTIKLVNSDFMLFTDLSQLTKFKPYYWTNKASSPLLQPTIEVPESLNPHSFAGIGIDSDCLMAYKGPWPLAYTYRFPAQKMPWRYYIVSNDEKAHFEIDHEPLDDTRLLIFNSIDSSSCPQDTTARSIAERFPDSICILFETTEPVPLRQEGYSDIRLKKDDKIRIPHLPNPAIVDQGVRVVHMP